MHAREIYEAIYLLCESVPAEIGSSYLIQELSLPSDIDGWLEHRVIRDEISTAAELVRSHHWDLIVDEYLMKTPVTAERYYHCLVGDADLIQSINWMLEMLPAEILKTYGREVVCKRLACEIMRA